MVLVCSDILHLVNIKCSSSKPGADQDRVQSGGITTFGPQIISPFGFDKFKTILLNMPFGAMQMIATMGGV